MKLREYAKAAMPSFVDDVFIGGVYSCPDLMLNLSSKRYNLCSKSAKHSDDVCHACWDQEYVFEKEDPE